MVNRMTEWNNSKCIFLSPADPSYVTFVASHTCTSFPRATKTQDAPLVARRTRGFCKSMLFVLIFPVISTVSFANNDSTLIRALVKEIAAMQVPQDDGEFYAGMFYGYRECGGFPHNKQRDNNIFFTALTGFSLKNMLPYLTAADRSLATEIVARAAATYPNFKNRFGNPFYNFWPTYAPIMPHTYYFKYLKGVFGQGEDADDSVMILMSSENNDSSNRVIKNRMTAVSNLSRKKIISTFKKYRGYPAYSTWLGSRMTPDFDFSVQCNIMYFMLQKQLPFTKQDTATVQLLATMVKNREYIKHPVYISPYYVKSSVELYHLARLMAAFRIAELEVYKPQLIADIRKVLAESANIMDSIILSTSLLRLKAAAPPLELKTIQEFEQSNQQQYIFFQARPAFSYPTPFKQVFLQWSYINYYFYCPAYNKTLWLEYLVEKNKAPSNGVR
jgi:hypothetical protein